MQVRLVLGPAGSGKTFRCLNEARQILSASPEGAPIVLLAPKQGTYQLEQQLLATPAIAGYSRLRVVSFESLARWILDRFDKPLPPTLSKEGRLMVFRAILAKERDRLNLFRASTRLSGFAQQLDEVLGQCETTGLDSHALQTIAENLREPEGLRYKLQDLAMLLGGYQEWLATHGLQDGQALLRAATDALREQASPGFQLEALWVDGFAEFTELELGLLSALLPFCSRALVTFCLPAVPPSESSWLSHWSPVEHTFRKCRSYFTKVAGLDSKIEILPRDQAENRFAKSGALQHLEQQFEHARPFDQQTLDTSVRLFACVDPEAEVTLAAREILRYVRAGARFRDIAVLVRNLEPYHRLVRRVFARYEIPCFLDRREVVSHHPLAELTRSGLRTVLFEWQPQDWFAVLKSGLLPVIDEEVDFLENEALARGWHGQAWLHPLELNSTAHNVSDPKRLEKLQQRAETIRQRIIPPFQQLAATLTATRFRPTGSQLVSALRELWQALGVQERLEDWATAEPTGSQGGTAVSVHATVWRQMNEWLDNTALAFQNEALSLREWLPIIESGLGAITVGIIPPALDQVLVGAVDRSRTPEVELALVLGLNDTVFPAKPETGRLLTETDRLALEKRNIVLGATVRRQLAWESYLAYIAFTRPRDCLILTYAMQDAAGAPLGPSSIISRVRQLFPNLPVLPAHTGTTWQDAQHPTEVAAILLQERVAVTAQPSLISLPALKSVTEKIQCLNEPQPDEDLGEQLAARLYGPILRTSVSRMEQFAACPFRFFIHSGLRAEERKLFEADIREQGTFQHDVLALFHESLRDEGKRWRDLEPQQARQRIAKIGQALTVSFRDGLFQSTDQSRFTARILTQSLQDFVETAVGWMREQYEFEPAEVELGFGTEDDSPAWSLELAPGKRLELYGRIDRLDLYRLPGTNRALCVIIDYKSSHKQLDFVLVRHGIQLQLVAYLNVARHWPDPSALLGVDALEPAGVFFVNLRGKYSSEANRSRALGETERARRLAYRHAGVFDRAALRHLDSRANESEGDQFNYRITGSGEVHKNCREAMPSSAFTGLLRESEQQLRRMGTDVFSGRAEVGPFRKGIMTACDDCGYKAICRIDPWTHKFRVLSADTPPAAEESSAEPSAP